jgi:formamidopyrimidine-DNA glycosylase
MTLSESRQLRFADQRKFGRVALATPADIQTLDRKLGVEPLGSNFTGGWLEDALARRTGPVKGVLLDQSLIAGIGNIYADEALFRAGIHPATPANSAGPEAARRLHSEIRKVLRSAIDRRGTSFSHYRDSAGEPGDNQFHLQVYGRGRSGSACPRCGGLLACIQVAGRSSHFCSTCQVLPATT